MHVVIGKAAGSTPDAPHIEAAPALIACLPDPRVAATTAISSPAIAVHDLKAQRSIKRLWTKVKTGQ